LYVYFLIWGVLLAWAWRLARQWRSTLLPMWAGLNSGRPAHAVWRATGFGSWWWFWVFYNLRHGFSRYSRFPTGSGSEVFMVTFIALIVVVVGLRRRRELGETDEDCERRLVTEFREVIREPLPEPTDPRFKRWNVRERFPWGWTMVQQQLHERAARRQLGVN
jgi:hypothetical protein